MNGPSLAPYLQAFFTEYLANQKRVSEQTIAAYRDAFRLLLRFIQDTKGITPYNLPVSELDAPTILAFLEHLETCRGNSVRSRNARLAAIRSFFRFVALRAPECSELVAQIMAIPVKCEERRLIGYLTTTEIEHILAVPDQAQWIGRRNHALLLTLYNTGARVSELIGLRQAHVSIGVQSFVHLHGKGRKERSVPLWTKTAQVLRSWLRDNGDESNELVFQNARRGPLTRQGVNYIIKQIVKQAAAKCPTLSAKAVSPHLFRHAVAMHLLQAGIDLEVIALWLGHEHLQTTHIYVEADLAMKERALAKLSPPDTHIKRFTTGDALMNFLSSL